MMSEEEKIALFDQYLKGEMNDTEAGDFQESLESDRDLNKEFEAYKSFSNLIRQGEEYGKIKTKLKGIHQELYGSKEKRIIILRPKFLLFVGVAASITLLILVIRPFQNGNDQTNAEVADYTELSNPESTDDAVSFEMVEENDEYTEEGVLASDSTSTILNDILPIMDNEPKGSCFLVSSKGYFITSKHLVKKRRYVQLQQKDRQVAFNAEVIYRDSLLDMAILRCSEEQAELFQHVPFKFYSGVPAMGEEVFTLGYPKSDIVYTTGVVSSETGFRSDSMSYQISMASNPGNSGAPLFTAKGDLVGMVIANNSKMQSVTYILKPNYIEERIQNLQSKFDIDMRKNYSKRTSRTSELIATYRPYIFEIH